MQKRICSQRYTLKYASNVSLNISKKEIRGKPLKGSFQLKLNNSNKSINISLVGQTIFNIISTFIQGKLRDWHLKLQANSGLILFNNNSLDFSGIT